MPFTFAHPAIVLPLGYLSKRWFSMTGLVIGSLTPDFEYFIRMKVRSDYSHTIAGLFWFDLPLGLLLSFLFHAVVKKSLFANFPTMLKSRFMGFNSFNWINYFVYNWLTVLISILTGAVSHLFWDSFTHHDGYFVRFLPILSGNLIVFNKDIPFFKILQHTSTLIGALMIAWTLFKIPPQIQTITKIDFKYWAIFTGITITIILARFTAGLPFNQYGNIIVTTLSAGLVSLILTPLVFKITNGTNTLKSSS